MLELMSQVLIHVIWRVIYVVGIRNTIGGATKIRKDANTEYDMLDRGTL